MNNQATLPQLTDTQLIERLITWHGREQAAQAAVIAHLIEVERRELYLSKGYPSLFAFCTESLGMSEDVAGTRIGAVRVARDYPCVLEMLADGRLYMSSIRLLRPHLRPENATELLQAAAGLSKRELEKLLAQRFPKPDVKPSVRKLPQRKVIRQTSAVTGDKAAEPIVQQNTLVQAPPHEQQGLDLSSSSVSSSKPGLSQTIDSADRQERRHNQVVPLSATRYKVTFTASAELVAKLDLAKALLSHAIKGQSVEAVIDRALTLLVEVEEKRRFGAPQKRRPQKREAAGELTEDTTSPPTSVAQEHLGEPTSVESQDNDTKTHLRYIPAAVRREVYERDGHRCTYRSPEGKRCSETRFLELDHVHTPWSHGGAHTADNLTLRCGMHNKWAARQLFGTDFVQSRIRERKQVKGQIHIPQHEHQQSRAHRSGGAR